MKTALLNFFLITALNLFEVKSDPFQKFFHYIASNVHLQKQAENSCEWQYALVKIKCNKTNKIISHSVLNTLPNDIKQ